MIPRGSQSRGGTPVSLISVHTSEGATNVRDLAHFLDGSGVEASYHVLVDDTAVSVYLPDGVASWAMLSGNNRSLQICLTGFSAWTRAEWLDSHPNMLRQAATVVRGWCQLYGIPTNKLTPSQVGADARGICGHWDWTLGKRDGTHTDPGVDFPWDVFIALVNGEDMQKDERDALFDVRMQLTGSTRLGDYPGWPARPDATPAAKSVADYVRALHAEQRAQRLILDQILAKLPK